MRFAIFHTFLRIANGTPFLSFFYKKNDDMKLIEETIRNEIPDAVIDDVLDLLISIAERIISKERIQKMNNKEMETQNETNLSNS